MKIHVALTSPTPDVIHRFRNLGEDLWREFRGDKRVAMDLAEVDRATDMLTLETRQGLAARTVRRVTEIVESHGLETHCDVKTE